MRGSIQSQQTPNFLEKFPTSDSLIMILTTPNSQLIFSALLFFHFGGRLLICLVAGTSTPDSVVRNFDLEALKNTDSRFPTPTLPQT